MRLKIYIPKGLSETSLLRGTAIVSTGEPLSSVPAMIRGYYEGNLYDISEMKSFRSRVKHAAGRLVTKYPTVAVQAFNIEALVQIGEMECSENGFVQWIAIFKEMEDMLNSWCQSSEPEESGISFEQDFGSNPLGNGKFIMVPSGRIVDLAERNKLLKNFEDNAPNGDHLICNRTEMQIQLLQGGKLE